MCVKVQFEQVVDGESLDRDRVAEEIETSQYCGAQRLSGTCIT